MDILLSVVASDLVGRLFSFLIGKYQKPGAIDTADRLQRALLRARVIVEEAEGRQIANRAMLQQLSHLRRELCRAAYAIDTFRWRASELSRSWRLQVMVESLEDALSDMMEFVVLLSSCPRVTRQPYSTYLYMENCMFGLQMEKEEIISFLSRPSQDLDILPIIGPHEVGKRTLVEHVCLDEKVRERFVKIHRLSSNHLDDFHIHEHHHRSLLDFTERSLIVIDVDDRDADVEESWRRFRSAVCHRALRGSKVIVISRKEAHSSMGTVSPIKLCPLRREDLWYFFRVLAFGPVEPDERPELARLAMTLCTGISRSSTLFTVANIIAASLRADLNVRSWRRVLKVLSEATMLWLGAAGDGLDEDKAGHYNLFRPVKDAPGVPCLFYNKRKSISMTQSDLPKDIYFNLMWMINRTYVCFVQSWVDARVSQSLPVTSIFDLATLAPWRSTRGLLSQRELG
ncbi:hypothetical protein EJB05_13622, partial [Eragrostis curvula]